MPIALSSFVFAAAVAVGQAAAPAANPSPSPQIVPASPSVVAGREPGVRLRGLIPGETVRLHAVRRMPKAVQRPDGSWGTDPVTLHAYADYRADARGEVDTAAVAPVRGSWRSAGGHGLLWSGYPQGAAELAGAGLDSLYPPASAPADAVVRLTLTRTSVPVAQAQLRVRDAAPNVRFVGVAEGAVNGVFAAPGGMRRGPTVILLHGSEGGDAGRARTLAARYASAGYAALALNYWAPEWSPLPGVPRRHVNTPIELLDQARAWLLAQPEVDGERIGVFGLSKGAEFAEVAAVRYPWIRAVVACVPTDIVWQGDPQGAPPGRHSSWSWRGEPLPYVPVPAWVQGRYRINTDRYEEGRRAQSAEALAAAVIPLETSPARVLLLGGGRDEVWASGAMTRRLQARYRAAGRSDRVEAHVWDTAGHMICGEGAFPTRLYNTQGADPRDKDVTAEGEATVEAWRLTQDFLRRTLGSGSAE